jgi:hypothetical protein
MIALDAVDIALLRVQYVAACDRYRVHAARLVELSAGGRRPPVRQLREEQQALDELATSRRRLLDALAATQHPEIKSRKENA